MNKEIYQVTIGALLHDIGKLIHRAGKIDGRSHSLSGSDFIKEFTVEAEILNSIRYHHKQEISKAKLAEESLAYPVYIADNISSGLDRRDIEGEAGSLKKFEKNLPLATVFNLLNNNQGKQSYLPVTLDERKGINYPKERSGIINTEHLYNQIYQDIKSGFAAIKFEPEYVNSVLELCEAYLSYIPSSTLQSQVSDISLYDHQKTTAALASCIVLYLNAQKKRNFKRELMTNEKQFYGEKAFLMMSCDISGIQQFIYTISSKGALKGLRARSFYLEMMLEHMVDEILTRCGLSRANLIYTGGGHAYLILPNTTQVREAIEQSKRAINRWLINYFGNILYLAFAVRECTAAELMNQTEDPEAYQNIFRDLSSQLSREKLSRYGADELRLLNKSVKENTEGRECVICGTVDHLLSRQEDDICETCLALQDISREIIREDIVILVTDEKLPGKTWLRLPSLDDKENYLYTLNERETKAILQQNRENLCRIYGKNRMMTGLKLTTKIWMGDYSAQGVEGLATFEELAERSAGIERIAVMRADVDNLGNAFVSGFLRRGPEANKYVTLSRTTALSRQLSIFYKFYINDVLSGNLGENIAPFRLSSKGGVAHRNVTIVYAGGDDVFIVGAWQDVIEVAVDLRKAFAQFCGGALTLSAGIGVYPASYPLSRMAAESEQLEKAAKDRPGKDSVSLFGEEIWNNRQEARHTYSWDEFEQNVVGEKLRLIQSFFAKENNSNTFGSSLLYNLMNLIRKAEEDGDRINIARFAYVLGRIAPSSEDEQRSKTYREFSRKMYAWILNPEDRRRLLTAILIHAYLLRTKED